MDSEELRKDYAAYVQTMVGQECDALQKAVKTGNPKAIKAVKTRLDEYVKECVRIAKNPSIPIIA